MSKKELKEIKKQLDDLAKKIETLSVDEDENLAEAEAQDDVESRLRSENENQQLQKQVIEKEKASEYQIQGSTIVYDLLMQKVELNAQLSDQTRLLQQENANLALDRDQMMQENMNLSLENEQLKTKLKDLSTDLESKEMEIKELEAIIDSLVQDEIVPGKTTCFSFDERVKQLTDYVKEHGNALVPQKDKKGIPKGLGGFVNQTRKLYKQGKLQQEKIEKLEEIGFVWRVKK